jgi:SAM-dependent methyltransferase
MIEKIPDLPENVLGFTAKGTVTAHDYESIIIPAVEALLAHHRKARFLYHLGKDFTGFEVAAVWDDTKIGLKHLTGWERMAIVSDVEWIRGAIRVFGLAIPGHVRVFHNREYAEASTWVCESLPSDNSSETAEDRVDHASHWERVYRTKQPDQVSWFQLEASLSLELIQHVAPLCDSVIIDVGAGASTLVDGLVTAGYRRLTVLDISVAALAQAQERLADDGRAVVWQNADVLTTDFPAGAFDVWHDRAVFHFLTEPADRARYVAQVRHAVKPGGFVLVATFAEDGPLKCSGLDVARYSAESLHSEFGNDFHVVESRREEHSTPWGAAQTFTYCLCRYEPSAALHHAA